MKRTGPVIIAILSVALIGVVTWGHLTRRQLERRYDALVEDRGKLELRLGEVLVAQQRLKDNFKNEQVRSQELSDTLASTRGMLQEMETRLTGESQNVRELQTRLTALQQQMEQLQGELVVMFQEQEQRQAKGRTKRKPQRATTKRADLIELQRIVVSGETSPAFHGRIVSVHHDWNFVIIDLGWDMVKVGDTVSIVRDEQLLARARVDRVQEGVCAATVLPEWETESVRVNDTVQML